MKIIRIFTLLILSSSITYFFQSCTKEKPSIPTAQTGDQIGISFSSMLQADFQDLIAEQRASISGNSPQENLGTYMGTFRDEAFDVAGYLKPAASKASGSKHLKASANSSTTAANPDLLAVQPMGKLIKYRVYLRNRSTGAWQTKVFTSGSTSGADTMMVYKHINYDWYAYSNNTEDIADVPDIRVGNVLNVSSQNKDLLWAKGEILSTTSDAQRRLQISFAHKLARLAINLDYRGLFVNTMSIYNFDVGFTGSGNTLRKGTLDLLSGNFVQNSHSNYNPTSTVKFTEPPYVDQQMYYFYSSEAQTFSTISVTYSNLSYTTYDGKTTTYGPSSNKSVSLTGVNGILTAIGGSTAINFLFIESPIYSGTTNTRWARANLYYAGDNIHNPYRFRRQTSQGANTNNTPNNTFTARRHFTAEQDMFMKNHKKPNSYINRPEADRDNLAIYPQGDVCSEVYPKGAWRKPTHAEFQSLVTSIPSSSYSTYFKGQTHVVGPYSSRNVGTPAYDSPFVTFERDGYMRDANTTVTVTNEGFYWSDLNPTTGYGSLLRITGTGSFLNPYSIFTESQGFHTAASIRCVRTNLF